MPQTFGLFYNRTKGSLRTLPSFLHFVLFIAVVLLAVLTFNFEVFRVIRFGDLVLFVFALIIAVHWYGQRMQEVGYKDGVKHARKER